MIWIIAILMLVIFPWPATLLGVAGFLIGDLVGLGIGLFVGLCLLVEFE
jgi:hypothetical protein